VTLAVGNHSFPAWQIGLWGTVIICAVAAVTIYVMNTQTVRYSFTILKTKSTRKVKRIHILLIGKFGKIQLDKKELSQLR
jgi:hypothetical protein